MAERKKVDSISKIVDSAHSSRIHNRIVRQRPEQLCLSLAQIEKPKAALETIEKAPTKRSVLDTGSFIKNNGKTKGAAKAAYIANPSRCLFCNEALLLKDGEKLDHKKQQRFCDKTHKSLFYTRRQDAARAAYIANPNRCLFCNEVIILKDGKKLYFVERQQFCSKTHSSLYYNRGVREKNEAEYYENPNHCEYCGSIIRIAPHEKVRDARAKKFCNHEHAALFHGTTKRNESIDEYCKSPNLCIQCGKAIPVKQKLSVAQTRQRKFCNYPSRCAALYNGNIEKAWMNERSCQECGMNFTHAHTSRKHCGDCSMLDVRKGDVSRSCIMTHARLVMKKNLKKCKKCNLIFPLECCHIQNVCYFQNDATLRVINAKENLVYLCRNHHYEFDCIDLETVDETVKEKRLWLERP